MTSAPHSQPAWNVLPTHQEARSAAIWRWVMCWCLPLLLLGCGTPQVTMIRPDPPPASLAAPCSAGPVIPAADTSLAELLDVIAGREAAAAECRARHRALVEAWPR